MKKILIYTFANFPYKNAFNREVFEFKRLKIDLDDFASEIRKHKPKVIFGVAKSSTKVSKFETVAVNIYNKTKKVDPSGDLEYKLEYPTSGFGAIVLNAGHTDSFCNWTMYKISQLIATTETKLQFVHIAESDIEDLKRYERFLKAD